LYHFDFYRFADPSEWETAGLADCFHRDAVCLIEWPERVAGRLPRPDLALTLTYPSDPSLPGRDLALVPYTEGGERCLTMMTSVDASPAA
jgi:tRNA threonylcarbamoyladenosine biosynthesis protein TsaE